MGKFVFFPWLDLETPFECAEFALLSYERGSSPGLTLAEQGIIDRLLAPYHEAHGRAVEQAVVVQHATQEIPSSDFDESIHADLFVFAELLAFAGLAGRQFFTNSGYSNRDTYRIVVQAFTDPERGVFTNTRRRDGVTGVYFAGDTYQVRRPEHVRRERVSIDPLLVSSLHEAMGCDGWPELFQAIVLFNQANTDRPEMSPETELILTYAAIEQALGSAGESVANIAQAFADTLVPQEELGRSNWKVAGENQRAVALLETSANLRSAWLRDLGNSRGSLAHGHAGDAYPACWNSLEHLLFGAHVVPLLVKARLVQLGLYEFTSRDAAGLDALELLLNERHFTELDNEDYAWRKIMDEFVLRAAAEEIAERFLDE